MTENISWWPRNWTGAERENFINAGDKITNYIGLTTTLTMAPVITNELLQDIGLLNRGNKLEKLASSSFAKTIGPVAALAGLGVSMWNFSRAADRLFYSKTTPIYYKDPRFISDVSLLVSSGFSLMSIGAITLFPEARALAPVFNIMGIALDIAGIAATAATGGSSVEQLGLQLAMTVLFNSSRASRKEIGQFFGLTPKSRIANVQAIDTIHTNEPIGFVEKLFGMHNPDNEIAKRDLWSVHNWGADLHPAVGKVSALLSAGGLVALAQTHIPFANELLPQAIGIFALGQLVTYPLNIFRNIPKGTLPDRPTPDTYDIKVRIAEIIRRHGISDDQILRSFFGEIIFPKLTERILGSQTKMLKAFREMGPEKPKDSWGWIGQYLEGKIAYYKDQQIQGPNTAATREVNKALLGIFIAITGVVSQSKELDVLAGIITLWLGTKSSLLMGQDDIDPVDRIAPHFARFSALIEAPYQKYRQLIRDPSSNPEAMRSTISDMLEVTWQECLEYYRLRKSIKTSDKKDSAVAESSTPTVSNTPSNTNFADLDEEAKIDRLHGFFSNIMDAVELLLTSDLEASKGKTRESWSLSSTSRAALMATLTVSAGESLHWPNWVTGVLAAVAGGALTCFSTYRGQNPVVKNWPAFRHTSNTIEMLLMKTALGEDQRTVDGAITAFTSEMTAITTMLSNERAK